MLEDKEEVEKYQKELVEKLRMRDNVVRQDSTYQPRIGMGEVLLLTYPNKLKVGTLKKLKKLSDRKQMSIRKVLRALGAPPEYYTYKQSKVKVVTL